jgi:hypothetical protein
MFAVKIQTIRPGNAKIMNPERRSFSLSSFAVVQDLLSSLSKGSFQERERVQYSTTFAQVHSFIHSVEGATYLFS